MGDGDGGNAVLPTCTSEYIHAVRSDVSEDSIYQTIYSTAL